MTPGAERKHFWLFWTLAIGLLVGDQASKFGVFNALYSGSGTSRGEVEIIPGAFKLLAQFTLERESGDGTFGWLRSLNGEMVPYVNTGALFGFGMHANTLFAIISLLAAGAIIFWSTRPSGLKDRSLSIALGLILAGTLGNLFDRVVFNGVRDFLYWHYVVDWPVFNFADCCLVCGAGLLLTQAFFHKPEHAHRDAADVTQQQAQVAGASYAPPSARDTSATASAKNFHFR